MNVVRGFMQNHPKYSSADELNERTVMYPHSGMLLSKKLTLDHKSMMNLKCAILSETNQTQEATCSMIPFIGHSGKGEARDRPQSVSMRG